MKESNFCRSVDISGHSFLYEIEVYLRLLIRWELRGHYGTQWKGVIKSDHFNNATDRRSQEAALGYLDANSNSVLSYLNLSELKDIILETKMWEKAFSSWGAKDLIASDFKKLIAARNKVAHFRAVTKRDFRNILRFCQDLADKTEGFSYRTPGEQWSSPQAILSKEEIKVVNERKEKVDIVCQKWGHHKILKFTKLNSYIDYAKLHDRLLSLENIVTFYDMKIDKVVIYFPALLDDSKLLKVVDAICSLFVDEPDQSNQATHKERLETQEFYIGSADYFPQPFAINEDDVVY